MLLNKHELEQVINEYDAMSIAFLKTPVDSPDLMEYVKVGAPSPGPQDESEPSLGWTVVMFISDLGEQRSVVETLLEKRASIPRFIFGTTSFQSFQLLRQLLEGTDIPRADVLLFRHKDEGPPVSLQLLNLVQSLEDLGQWSEYIAVMDDDVRFDTLSFDRMASTIEDAEGAILFPHHLVNLSEHGVTSKSNPHQYQHESTIYYVSTFDTGFDMDKAYPAFYRFMSPVKYAHMNHVMACSVATFQRLEFMEYNFDPDGSVLYASLNSGEPCVFMTSPMAFAMMGVSPIPKGTTVAATHRHASSRPPTHRRR